NGGLLIRMSQVQVLQGEPIKESRIIDAAFLHLKILASLHPPHLSNSSFSRETLSLNFLVKQLGFTLLI
ncbi:hypothetical protein, partial [Vibrio sp. FF145]|uniref:hypothetical protein n=1 Tax=unclassified Vibrio TaxID=2614977 RepID=UPI00352C3EDB